jgi:phosphoserine phosphatase
MSRSPLLNDPQAQAAKGGSCVGAVTKIVISDWDNTMRDGFTMADWTSFLAERRAFPAQTAGEIRTAVDDYKRSAITYEELAHQVAALYAFGLAGKSKWQIEQLSDEFVADDQDRIFQFVPSFVSMLRHASLRLVVVSGCPIEPLIAYQKSNLFDEAFGLAVDTSNGRYIESLRVNPTLGNEKAKIVKRLAAESSIVLALGDSPADLPLLDAAPSRIIVGNAGLSPSVAGDDLHISPHSKQWETARRLSAIVERVAQR